MTTDTLQYHRTELDTARDPAHPGHCLPKVEPRHKRVLDVGCGMGQILLALNLSADVEAHGVDPDERAVEEGRKLMPPHINLQVRTGESLPYPNAMFDLVICRVALPYMRVEKALAEMARVTAPGGDVWLMMHPAKMYLRRAWRSLTGGRVKDFAYCGFVLANGLLLNLTVKQIRIGNRTETFQTPAGMTTALRRLGFDSIAIQTEPFLLAQCRKP